MSNKMREDFEEFATHWRYDLTIDENDFYTCAITQRIWDAWSDSWQASRAAIVVELPAQWTPSYEEREVMAAICVLESLEKAGVSYKCAD